MSAKAHSHSARTLRSCAYDYASEILQSFYSRSTQSKLTSQSSSAKQAQSYQSSRSQMSGFRDIAKGGWHPKAKDGRAESWRGDFKGINQVAGWVGKGKDTSGSKIDEAKEHYSAPLSTLKDPAAFGPPPKHRHYHGAAASPSTTTPDRGGWGAPVPEPRAESISSASSIPAQLQQLPLQQEESQRPAPPPLPYRADTTGLKTDNLPKPPVRRIDPNIEPESASPVARQPRQAATVPRPTPPPRLPARQNSHPDAFSEPPPPAYQDAGHDEKLDEPASSGYLNQGSLNRLGNAGVAVPGFNIGRQESSAGPNTSSGAGASQVNELQQRFARFRTPSSDESQSVETTTSGTSWAQKRSALQTASKFQRDPSSVSVSDARQAVSTANNFRQRHGDQVASGVKTANSFNQKYGVGERVGVFLGTSQDSPGAASRETVVSPPRSLSYDNTRTRGTASESTSVVAAAAAKKAPPPPPPKKRNLTGLPNDEQSATNSAAPPVPLATRPR